MELGIIIVAVTVTTCLHAAHSLQWTCFVLKVAGENLENKRKENGAVCLSPNRRQGNKQSHAARTYVLLL